MKQNAKLFEIKAWYFQFEYLTSLLIFMSLWYFHIKNKIISFSRKPVLVIWSTSGESFLPQSLFPFTHFWDLFVDILLVAADFDL